MNENTLCLLHNKTDFRPISRSRKSFLTQVTSGLPSLFVLGNIILSFLIRSSWNICSSRWFVVEVSGNTLRKRLLNNLLGYHRDSNVTGTDWGLVSSIFQVTPPPGLPNYFYYSTSLVPQPHIPTILDI